MSSVDHPDHYNEGNIEAIEIIEDWEIGFHLGNVVKYVLRAPYKENPKKDLQRAKWYIDRYIDTVLEKEK